MSDESIKDHAQATRELMKRAEHLLVSAEALDEEAGRGRRSAFIRARRIWLQDFKNWEMDESSRVNLRS